jgi:hypothetical protein
MLFYLFIAINNVLRNNNALFQNKENNIKYNYNVHKTNISNLNNITNNIDKKNDAALMPLEDLPKNKFYDNFNNNYSKKFKSIIYPP